MGKTEFEKKKDGIQAVQISIGAYREEISIGWVEIFNNQNFHMT